MSYLDPIWTGNTIFEEPICFSTNADKQPIGGMLLYSPTEILRITSFDRKITYIEGIDYLLCGNTIIRLEGSSIPYLSRSIYCKPFVGIPETAWVRLPGGKEYMEVVSNVHEYQVLVTYRHSEKWKMAFPMNESHRLEHVFSRLSSQENFNLVFYGDSITAGWEASGANEQAVDMVTLEDYHVHIQHPPFMPTWAELVTAALKKAYPSCNIHKYNRAAGGSTTGWGETNADILVNPYHPDLIILAFGMNSMQDSPEQYNQQISSIINTIRSRNPECGFILVSPMIPNPEIAGFQNNKLRAHEQELFRISNELPNVAVAPVHSLFLDLQRIGKNYLELTGNIINHPNDFSVRIYAQTILSALGLDK